MTDSIKRSEWDFRAAQKGTQGYWPLETWEVPFCYLYEFARHGADADPAIEPEWRKNCTPRTYEALREKYFKHDPNGKQGYLIMEWFYAVWPEWPERPYQSVSAAERAKRIRGSSGGGVPNLKVVPIEALTEQRPGTRHENGMLVYERGIGSQAKRVVMVAFEIDFSLSTRRLRNQFEAWCQRERMRRNVRFKENRGPASNAARLRGRLQQLGAWRLQERFTLGQAILHTKAVSGKPLYAHRTAWCRAVRRVKGLLGIL